MSALTVVKPGFLTTVQDLGRFGHQNLGVPPSGPMDTHSHRLANQLVDNDASAAALEMTILGAAIQADADVVCAVTGADVDVLVDGHVVAGNACFTLPAGGRLSFGARRAGARMSLAIAGGIDVPMTFGSRATHLASRMGPFGGRPLRVGDRLPVGVKPRSERGQTGVRPRSNPSLTPLVLPAGGARVRVVAGGHRDRFTERGWQTLTTGRFVVTPNSNRMGYRLDGTPVEHIGAADILSEGTSAGAIQVPASGQPILLMAERATTGGYAMIANVITADLPYLGQLAPGDWIEFVPCTLDEAVAALDGRSCD